MDKPPLIDCHAHVFSQDMPVRPDAWTRPAYSFSADDLIARMDQHGVRLAALSGLSISGTYNDDLIRALRRYPDRLRGTVILDAPGNLHEMEALHRDGVRGVRLQLVRSPALPDLDSFAWRMLLARVRDLDWHVQLAVEDDRLDTVLAPLLAAGVKVVIDHFGHPDPADPLGCQGMAAMLRAVDTGRCWIKLSGGFRLPGPSAWQDDPEGDLETLADRVAAHLLARVGTDRLLWGSDAPFVGYERRVTYEDTLASFCRRVPDAVQRAEIGETGRQLYFG